MPVPETVDQALTEEFNRLRGRLCGLIESWGLPERQERGAIQTLKSLSYDSQKHLAELLAQSPDA
jgi:hypothetical protein